jgi:hypothetical protein
VRVRAGTLVSVVSAMALFSWAMLVPFVAFAGGIQLRGRHSPGARVRGRRAVDAGGRPWRAC